MGYYMASVFRDSPETLLTVATQYLPLDVCPLMQLTGLDSRQGALNDWLATRTSFGFDLATLAPASSDASFRRYFRLNSNRHGSLVVMDAPPDKEDCRPFIKLAAALEQAGVSAPRVLDQDLSLGFIVLTDLGDTTYLKAFEDADALQLGRLMNDAQDVIHRIQDKVDASALAPYDEILLLREMQLFPDWYLSQHCNLALSDADKNMLDTLFKTLSKSSLGQTQLAVHRDYHCRNLMVLDSTQMDGNPGVLDFQDAVSGAITYDLVSLLRDAYVEWPEQQVLDWTVRFWERGRRRGIELPQDFADFWQAFELMGLQRHLKVLGIFARLSHRDGKHGYLADLPLVEKYVRAVAARYRLAAPLMRLLDRAAKQQPVTGYTF
jgi:aminoglycoside/choline kinase family phosphotransferase